MERTKVCICWSESTTTKSLRHITIRENTLCELVQNEIVSFHHIADLFNITDIFTKKLKDTATFAKIRDAITSPVANTPYLSSSSEYEGIPTYAGTLLLLTID